MTGNPIPKDDNHTKESNHELIWKELKKKKKKPCWPFEIDKPLDSKLKRKQHEKI